nr:DUF3499 domain-containing protein [Zhihengliuella flava]
MCSRSGCRESAVATLTYVYADSTAVLGPLATYAEPHCYDLCSAHASRLTVPRGWDVLRLDLPAAPRLASDELSALADAVREHRDHGDATPKMDDDAGHREAGADGSPASSEDTSRRSLTPPDGADGIPKPGDKPALRILRNPHLS